MTPAKSSHHVRGAREQDKAAEQEQEVPEVHRERKGHAEVPAGHPSQGLLQLLDVVRHAGLQSAHGQGEGECTIELVFFLPAKRRVSVVTFFYTDTEE